MFIKNSCRAFLGNSFYGVMHKCSHYDIKYQDVTKLLMLRKMFCNQKPPLTKARGFLLDNLQLFKMELQMVVVFYILSNE